MGIFCFRKLRKHGAGTSSCAFSHSIKVEKCNESKNRVEYPVVKRLGLEPTNNRKKQPLNPHSTVAHINKLMLQNGAFLDFFPNFFYHDFIII
jgi:hypothetical protein